jgi:hypothetical protein
MKKTEYQQLKKYIQKLEGQNEQLKSKVDRLLKVADSFVFNINDNIALLDRSLNYNSFKHMDLKHFLENDIEVAEFLKTTPGSLFLKDYDILCKRIEHKKDIAERLVEFLDNISDLCGEVRDIDKEINVKEHIGNVPIDEEFSVVPQSNFKRWW